MNNLLSDSLITVATKDGPGGRVSLPQALSMCVSDDVQNWPALRPHQYPAWHMFLVQIAVLAQRAAGERPLVSEQDWRRALRLLSEDYPEDEPWRLAVSDWSKPAFLQPPCPLGKEAEYKSTVNCADSLDLLITAKNHDLKKDVDGSGDAEQWLYALLSLQTTEGFLGAGNYGIARMNGGFASRPMLRCYAASLGIGGQVMRDVEVLLNNFDSWYDRTGVGTEKELQPLLWLLPWDGTSSLPLSHFHPFAIEVCRRVRLIEQNHHLSACLAGSKKARVDAKALKGNVGCPWTPIDRKEAKSFTLSGDGFSYKRMVKLLDKELYTQPLLAEPCGEDQEGSDALILLAAGIARGQGKTEGVHQRRIVLSAVTVTQLFAKRNQQSEFIRRSHSFMDMAALVYGKALRPALIQRIDGSADPNWQNPLLDGQLRPWQRRYDQQVDQHFFEDLDASFTAEEVPTEPVLPWSQRLALIARQVFEQANKAFPANTEARILGEARARGRLDAGLWQHLPLLRKPSQQESANDAA